MDTDKQPNTDSVTAPTLPRGAYLPINRCNLPAVILGSLTFQHYPERLHIDGVEVLHRDLFRRLDAIRDAGNRAQQFIDYMDVHFRLHNPAEAGLTDKARIDRSNADYQRLLRGWAFDAEARDGAVMKGWVETRFGLVPRYHKVRIRGTDDPNYLAYQHAVAEGLYNTNALESQLDLLYTYCQYELHRQHPERGHLTLYRGSNAVETVEVNTGDEGSNSTALLPNNLNSFSCSMERASEFGDSVYRIEVPLSKVVFYSELLPRYLKAENEFIVIGGVYAGTRVM